MTPADWHALGVDAAQEDITAARPERDAARADALRCTTIDEARQRVNAWLVPAEPDDIETAAQGYLATWTAHLTPVKDAQ